MSYMREVLESYETYLKILAALDPTVDALEVIKVASTIVQSGIDSSTLEELISDYLGGNL